MAKNADRALREQLKWALQELRFAKRKLYFTRAVRADRTTKPPEKLVAEALINQVLPRSGRTPPLSAETIAFDAGMGKRSAERSLPNVIGKWFFRVRTEGANIYSPNWEMADHIIAMVKQASKAKREKPNKMASKTEADRQQWRSGNRGNTSIYWRK